jgi:hypothetical protein
MHCCGNRIVLRYMFDCAGARATAHARALSAGLVCTVMWKPARSVVLMQTAAAGTCAMAACASARERSATRAAAASLAPIRRVAQSTRAAQIRLATVRAGEHHSRFGLCMWKMHLVVVARCEAAVFNPPTTVACFDQVSMCLYHLATWSV